MKIRFNAFRALNALSASFRAVCAYKYRELLKYTRIDDCCEVRVIVDRRTIEILLCTYVYVLRKTF